MEVFKSGLNANKSLILDSRSLYDQVQMQLVVKERLAQQF